MAVTPLGSGMDVVRMLEAQQDRRTPKREQPVADFRRVQAA